MQLPPLTVWRFCDGNTGHEKQTLALLQGLQRCARIDCHDIPVRRAPLGGLLNFLRGKSPDTADLPAPDLIIGVGHSTHWPMLSARRQFGGKVLVLMTPSLPLSWFDLAVIPAHDQPKAGPRVLISASALAPDLACQADPARGLILLGGESRHFRWDAGAINTAIHALVSATPEVQWQLTTSRRTPADQALPQAPNLTAYRYADLPADWLGRELSRAGHVCLTVDSASMLAEALNSAAQVSLLPLPSKTVDNKLLRGITPLHERGLVTLLGPDCPAPPATASDLGRAPLNEHHRCAQEALQRLFPERF